MSDYINPILELSEIDEDECLSGYRAGLGFVSIDYTKKNASYWHGYRNGQVDRGLEPITSEQQKFAQNFVAGYRTKGMH